MAGVWKHPQSKYYTACWTDANGRRIKRSTKETDEKKARKIAEQYEEETRTIRTEMQVRRVIEDIHRKYSSVTLQKKTVREFFVAFIESKQSEKLRKSTIDYYGGSLKRFLQWIEGKADNDIARITRQDVTAYRNHIGTKAGPHATNNSLRAVKAFFAAAKDEGLITDDPADPVKTVKVDTEPTKRPFSLQELRIVIARANPEWQSMIKFGLYSGQRLGDIAMLTWTNIDTQAGVLKIVTRKTGRKQEIPIAPVLLAHIRTLPAKNDLKSPLHPRAFALVKTTGKTSKLSAQFAEILTEAGLRTATEAEEGHARARHELSFHSLRHTATSLLKSAGIPQSVVMAFVGHDSAEVSHGYTHVGKESLEKAAAALPEI